MFQLVAGVIGDLVEALGGSLNFILREAWINEFITYLSKQDDAECKK